MHRKGPRQVPDFSRHATQKPAPDARPSSARAPRAPAPPPTVKPQATSAKSGRRGQ